MFIPKRSFEFEWDIHIGHPDLCTQCRSKFHSRMIVRADSGGDWNKQVPSTGIYFCNSCLSERPLGWLEAHNSSHGESVDQKVGHAFLILRAGNCGICFFETFQFHVAWWSGPCAHHLQDNVMENSSTEFHISDTILATQQMAYSRASNGIDCKLKSASSNSWLTWYKCRQRK